jgi:hypothetical protein
MKPASMGAAHLPSLKGLQIILKCNDQELRKLGIRMSEAAIHGSMEIWQRHARQAERGTQKEVNELLDAEIHNMADEDAERSGRGREDQQAEVDMNQELNHEEIAGAGVGMGMGSQEDIGGQDREGEGAEWNKEEMRDSMDEWNRTVEARAEARTGIGIEDGQASDEGGGDDLDMP